MSFTTTTSGYRRVETRVGDTLQRIALRETGDAANWPVLANLNGLMPPYITGDPLLAGERVLLFGEMILIPAAAPIATAVADPVSVFGADLSLTAGRLGATDTGDLSIVAGIPNLTAALHHRIDTHTGDLIRHPQYGCMVHKLLGSGNGSSTQLLAAAWVERALKADSRIASVASSAADLSGDTVQCDAVAVTVDGKHVPVGVVQ